MVATVRLENIKTVCFAWTSAGAWGAHYLEVVPVLGINPVGLMMLQGAIVGGNN